MKLMLWLMGKEELHYDEVEIFLRGMIVGGAIMTGFCLWMFLLTVGK